MKSDWKGWKGWGMACLLAAGWLSGCQTPTEHRTEADDVAARLIAFHQEQALGRTEPFSIQTSRDSLRRRLIGVQGLQTSSPASLGTDRLLSIPHWPEADMPRRSALEGLNLDLPEAVKPLNLSLVEALQIAARNSREYQTQKEQVFDAALDLDLEVDDFRNTYDGLLESLLTSDQAASQTGVVTSAETSMSRKFESGAILTGRIIVDLANLISDGGGSSAGIVADLSMTVPLLRGAGRHIVTEPLTQAQRNLIYQIWTFEEFKRSIAVDVADAYLGVLQDQDRIQNAENNYRRQIESVRRARRMADAGRTNKIQLDQARQAELEARQNWILARQRYENSLDDFKLLLGLPTDAIIELDRVELQMLADAAHAALAKNSIADGTPEQVPPAGAPIELADVSHQGAGPYELSESHAIRLALDNRLDLRIRQGRVYDAQRGVVIAADALQAGLTLMASASNGSRRGVSSAGQPSAKLDIDQSSYAVGAELEMPWERTGERNSYRQSYVTLEQNARSVQELEDRIKLEVRQRLRNLIQTRETFRIQLQAVQLAEQRVRSNKMFLEAGRGNVQIRDVLEAEDSLLNAQNALTAALVSYRVNELRLQSDLGVLNVDEQGLWQEFDPQKVAVKP